MITIEWPATEAYVDGGGGGSKKPTGKKPPAKKSGGKGNALSADDKKFIKQNTSSDFNSKHPRAAAGSAAGGQFTKGGGGSKSSGSGKKAPAKKPAAKGKLTAAHTSKTTHAGGGGLAYKAGYDKKGGDTRVKGLQSRLNKLGLTDAAGKPLAVDGKLGPKTTAAIKKAQKRLGMKPTGKADAAFLNKLKAGNGKKSAGHRKGVVGTLVIGKTMPGKGKPSTKRPVRRPAKRPLAGSAGAGTRKTAREADMPMRMPYGDVRYADPGYQADKKKRYPIDTADHCRAAWSYINQAGNAGKYSPEQVKNIKGRIRAAAKKFGVQIGGDQ